MIGDAIDEGGPIPTNKRLSIHAEAPDFDEMSVEHEILVTAQCADCSVGWNCVQK